MWKQKYKDGLVDLIIGLVCGVIGHFSFCAILVLGGVAVVALFIVILKGWKISSYGHDENGNFRIEIVLIRILTVWLGVFVARVSFALLFPS